MTTSKEAIVTIPPEVVRIRASSTVFVKASSLVNLDFAGIFNARVRHGHRDRFERWRSVLSCNVCSGLDY
jgi:hypothetical protein